MFWVARCEQTKTLDLNVFQQLRQEQGMLHIAIAAVSGAVQQKDIDKSNALLTVIGSVKQLLMM